MLWGPELYRGLRRRRQQGSSKRSPNPVSLSAEQGCHRPAQAIQHRGLVQAEHRYTTQTALERERRILKVDRQGRRNQVCP